MATKRWSDSGFRAPTVRNVHWCFRPEASASAIEPHALAQDEQEAYRLLLALRLPLRESSHLVVALACE